MTVARTRLPLAALATGAVLPEVVEVGSREPVVAEVVPGGLGVLTSPGRDAKSPLLDKVATGEVLRRFTSSKILPLRLQGTGLVVVVTRTFVVQRRWSVF